MCSCLFLRMSRVKRQNKLWVGFYPHTVAFGGWRVGVGGVEKEHWSSRHALAVKANKRVEDRLWVEAKPVLTVSLVRHGHLFFSQLLLQSPLLPPYHFISVYIERTNPSPYHFIM